MPWSHPGPSVSGRKIPDSSSSGTTTVLISGANASSLLTTSPVAYDTEASPMATNMMNTNPISTAGSGARSPNATPTSTSTTSVTTSRSTRPAMMASRLTGVTRNRSITPDRQSEMMAKPTNVEPNSASWISRPGTKNRYALPPPPSDAPGRPFSSGP